MVLFVESKLNKWIRNNREIMTWIKVIFVVVISMLMCG